MTNPQQPTHAAPEQTEWKPDMAHCANEWADVATNGLQWLRNIRDGISTVEAAIANMELGCRHCQDVAAQVDALAAGGESLEGARVNPHEARIGLRVMTPVGINTISRMSLPSGQSDAECFFPDLPQGANCYRVSQLRHAPATHPQGSEPAPKRPPNCGTGHCSCIECHFEPASNVPMTDEELAILNERGAKAWAGVNPQDLRDGSYSAPSTAGDWTGNVDIDAALIMLDRLDVSADDDARVDAISATLRKAAALLQSTALPDHIGDANKMVAALPVGELTDKQIKDCLDAADQMYCERDGDREIFNARAILAADRSQPVQDKQTPFVNCKFRICDLPGQCKGEGKCHHPINAAPLAQPVNAELVIDSIMDKVVAHETLVNMNLHARLLQNRFDIKAELRAALSQSAPLPQPQGERVEVVERLVDVAYKHWQHPHIFPMADVRADFRAALLEVKPVPLPWTGRQVERMYRNSPELHKDVTTLAEFTRVTRAIESAHGITAQGEQKRKGNV